MAINNFITEKASCIRVFTFELLAGKEDEYQTYLSTVVEVIDHDAHQKDVFLDVLTLKSDATEQSRLFHRVFLFKDSDQRTHFAERMAACALAYDGNKDEQQRRKAYVNTLRVQHSVNDYTFN